MNTLPVLFENSEKLQINVYMTFKWACNTINVDICIETLIFKKVFKKMFSRLAYCFFQYLDDVY